MKKKDTHLCMASPFHSYFFLQHLKIDNIQYYLQSVFWLITTWYEIANITVLNKMLEANMQN